jgi:hypothetical protein
MTEQHIAKIPFVTDGFSWNVINDPAWRRRISAQFRRFKAQLTHCKNKVVMIDHVSRVGQTPASTRFSVKEEGKPEREVSVLQYFKDKYKMPLAHAKEMPLAVLRRRIDGKLVDSYFPLDVLSIPAGPIWGLMGVQERSDITKATTLRLDDTFNMAHDARATMKEVASSMLSMRLDEFVKPKFEILAKPNLRSMKNERIDVKSGGRWDVPINTPPIRRNVFLWFFFPERNERIADAMGSCVSELKKVGVLVREHKARLYDSDPRNHGGVTLPSILGGLGEIPSDPNVFVIIVLKEQESIVKSGVKAFCVTKRFIPTQFFMERNFTDEVKNRAMFWNTGLIMNYKMPSPARTIPQHLHLGLVLEKPHNVLWYECAPSTSGITLFFRCSSLCDNRR